MHNIFYVILLLFDRYLFLTCYIALNFFLYLLTWDDFKIYDGG